MTTETEPLPSYRVEYQGQNRAVIVDSGGMVISRFASREDARKALEKLLATGGISR